MSESQERMMAVVEPDHVEDFLAICRKWDVLATVIGEVTAGDRLVIDWHGETVVDVPPRTVAHEGPVYERPTTGRSGKTRSRPTELISCTTGHWRRAGRHLAPHGQLAQPLRQVLGH